MADIKKQSASKDKDSNAILITFILAIVVMCALILIYRLYNSSAVVMVNTYDVLVIVMWAALGLFALSAVFTACIWKKWSGRKRRLCITFSAVSLILCFSCFMMSNYYLTGVKLLCGLYAIAFVLYLVYLIYKWEFFSICSLIAISGMALWLLMSYASGLTAAVILAVGLVCCGLWAAALLVAKRNRGVLQVFGRKLQPFKKSTHYGPMLAVILLSAAALIIGFISPLLCYYCMIALVCVAFICAVYYTVKLM